MLILFNTYYAALITFHLNYILRSFSVKIVTI